METEEITRRAAMVADAIDQLDLLDAVAVFATGCNESVKRGGSNNETHCLVGVYFIAQIVNNVHGCKGIIEIRDDGSVAFTIQAGKEKLLKVG